MIVLERATDIAPVGSGIGLAPNAQRALDALGLGDAVRSLAVWQAEGGLLTPSGRWLSRTSGAAAAERFGGPVVVAHRAALVGLLAAELPPGALRTGSPAQLTEPGDPGDPRHPALVRTPARVRTGADAGAEEEFEAALVVAADGVHSGSRNVLFPAHPGPRYAGFTAWRMVVPAPELPFAPHETWGRGTV